MNISGGCIHCDARSKCYNMDHEFEDVEIKINAPESLEETLKKKCMIGAEAVSDPYISVPENLDNIRVCLKIIEKYGFGLTIQTKSNMTLQGIELLKIINNNANCIVEMDLTAYDENMRNLNQYASTTKERSDVLKIMRDNNIQTIVC